MDHIFLMDRHETCGNISEHRQVLIFNYVYRIDFCSQTSFAKLKHDEHSPILLSNITLIILAAVNLNDIFVTLEATLRLDLLIDDFSHIAIFVTLDHFDCVFLIFVYT